MDELDCEATILRYLGEPERSARVLPSNAVQSGFHAYYPSRRAASRAMTVVVDAICYRA